MKVEYLLEHFFRNNHADVVGKSYLNCHSVGVHSVMLLDQPGCRIRMFVTDNSHELWKNHPNGDDPFSLAFHPHHCDISIQAVRGVIVNHLAIPGRGRLRGRLLNEYSYEPLSPGSRPSFKDRGIRASFGFESTPVLPGDVLHLSARDIHTVEVNAMETAAWIVWEGKEDERYRPLAYSNDPDLGAFDASGLYIRPTEDDVLGLLGDALEMDVSDWKGAI
jgi:hypothetical protein